MKSLYSSSVVLHQFLLFFRLVFVATLEAGWIERDILLGLTLIELELGLSTFT